MTRYFYTDPLAAAWMAKHFEMRFCDPDDNEPFDNVAPADIAQWYAPIYIYSDSLRLLKPQVGDLYYNSCNGSYHEVTEKGSNPPGGRDAVENWGCRSDNIDLATAAMWWNGGKTHDRIIQRHGLAFHWPESEEA